MPPAAFEQRWHFQHLSPGRTINIAWPKDLLPFSGNSCLSIVSPLLLAEHGIGYEDAYLLVLGALPLVCSSQALPYMWVCGICTPQLGNPEQAEKKHDLLLSPGPGQLECANYSRVWKWLAELASCTTQRYWAGGKVRIVSERVKHAKISGQRRVGVKIDPLDFRLLLGMRFLDCSLWWVGSMLVLLVTEDSNKKKKSNCNSIVCISGVIWRLVRFL